MSRKYKAGDLALMVPNGRTVQILSDMGNPHTIEWDGLFFNNPNKLEIYEVEFLSGPVKDLHGTPRKTGPLSERRLMPLKGDEQPAQVRQAERVQ